MEPLPWIDYTLPLYFVRRKSNDFNCLWNIFTRTLYSLSIYIDMKQVRFRGVLITVLYCFQLLACCFAWEMMVSLFLEVCTSQKRRFFSSRLLGFPCIFVNARQYSTHKERAASPGNIIRWQPRTREHRSGGTGISRLNKASRPVIKTD